MNTVDRAWILLGFMAIGNSVYGNYTAAAVFGSGMIACCILAGFARKRTNDQ